MPNETTSDEINRPSAAEDAGHVIEHGVGLSLVLEQLNIGIEQITLRDMDVLERQLVDELENAGGDGGLPDGGNGGVGAERGLVLEDDAVELGDVELVGGGAGGDGEGEAAAGEDGAGEGED